MIEHHLAFLARRAYASTTAPSTISAVTRPVSCEPIVAGKIRLAGQLDRVAQLGAEFAGGARAAALRLHGRVEARLIDREAALARHVRRQVEREAIGVVESKHRFARNDGRGQLGRLGVEQRHAGRQRFGEAGLFLREHLHGARLAAHQFAVIAAHLPHQARHQLVKEGLRLPELVAMADRAPDDAPQYVAAPLVGGHHTVDDQKSAGADVIRDDPQARGIEILSGGELRGGADQRLEQIDVVIAVHALHAPRRRARGPCRYPPKAWAAASARRPRSGRIA